MTWAIATPHTAATRAGANAFETGANAVDAALTAACALAVVYPHMCSPGGDVIALVREADGAVHAVNGSGRAARGLSAEAARDGVPATGPLTITVPGAVSAWETLATRWGSRPLAAAIEPAIAYARDGIRVAPSLAGSIAYESGLMAANSGLADVFMPGGKPLLGGEMLVQPALARTLETLAREGAPALYGGEVGHALVDGLGEVGSPLALEDFSTHATDVDTPLSGSYRGYEILTSGPNSQGFVLLQILAALERLDLADALGADAPLLAQLFRETAADRDRHLADPASMAVRVEELLSGEHIERIASAVRRSGGSSAPPPPPPASGDTIALVTADGSGNAVSLIQSLYGAFGSGILEPRTGIILQNRGACFSSDPMSPNAIAPGKRPLHTLMPVMLHRGGRVFSVNGTMGGRVQPQIHAQILLRLLGGASPVDSVGDPRFIVDDGYAPGDTDVFVEEDAEEARSAFGAAGVPVAVGGHHDEEAGHAQLILALADGSFAAASDPRADGSAETD